jgi:hypothetical protein
MYKKVKEKLVRRKIQEKPKLKGLYIYKRVKLKPEM